MLHIIQVSAQMSLPHKALSCAPQLLTYNFMTLLYFLYCIYPYLQLYFLFTNLLAYFLYSRVWSMRVDSLLHLIDPCSGYLLHV